MPRYQPGDRPNDIGDWELEGSKVVRFRLFASREQAFEAAGVAE